MKNLFLALFLGLTGLAKADLVNGLLFLSPSDLFQGDAVSKPLSAVNGDNTLHYSRFLSQTVATMPAATGVTLVANFLIPTTMKEGRVTIGFTAIYGGVTNSAVVSPTAKVQTTTYNDPGSVTTTTISVLAPVALTAAGLYGRYTDVTLGTVSGVYPGNLLTVHLTRALGSNQNLHIARVWVRFTPAKGWGPF